VRFLLCAAENLSFYFIFFKNYLETLTLQVEGLNSGSLEDYLSLVRENYPLEEEDHLRLEQAARAAVTSGPAVYLTNLMAKLHGLKRKHVKCLVFFKENPELLLESGVQVGTATVKGKCTLLDVTS
jgi:hypothetical protein